MLSRSLLPCFHKLHNYSSICIHPDKCVHSNHNPLDWQLKERLVLSQKSLKLSAACLQSLETAGQHH